MMLCCCKASSDNPRLSIRAAVCNPFLPFPVFLARVLAVQPSSLSKIQNQRPIRRSLGEVGSSFVNLFFFLPADLRSPTSVLWPPLSISSRHPPAIPLIHGCSNHPPGMRSTTTSTRRSWLARAERWMAQVARSRRERMRMARERNVRHETLGLSWHTRLPLIRLRSHRDRATFPIKIPPGNLSSLQPLTAHRSLSLPGTAQQRRGTSPPFRLSSSLQHSMFNYPIYLPAS